MAWPNGQLRVCAIPIQSSQVPGSGTHDNFPALLVRVNLPDEICSPTDANRAQSDGGDIRIAANSDGTGQVPIDIIKWEYDSVHGAGDADIQIRFKRNIDTSSNTENYIAYKTPGTTVADGVADTYGRNNTYDTIYKVLYAMDEASGSLIDRTGNGNDATVNGNPTFSVAAQIGNGVDYDGVGDHHEASDSVSLSITSSITIRCWINPDSTSTSGNNQGLLAKYRNQAPDTDERSYGLNYVDGDINFVFSSNGQFESANSLTSLTGPITATSMQCVVGRLQAGVRSEIFVDNTSVANDTTSVGSTIDDNASPLWVARQFNALDILKFKGIMDQAEIIADAPSNDYLSARFNNEKNPQLFIIEGTPTDVPGGWTGTINDVTNPAIVNGVNTANISKISSV